MTPIEMPLDCMACKGSGVGVPSAPQATLSADALDLNERSVAASVLSDTSHLGRSGLGQTQAQVRDADQPIRPPTQQAVVMTDGRMPVRVWDCYSRSTGIGVKLA